MIAVVYFRDSSDVTLLQLPLQRDLRELVAMAGEDMSLSVTREVSAWHMNIGREVLPAAEASSNFVSLLSQANSICTIQVFACAKMMHPSLHYRLSYCF
jgi:hypothetical protein